MDLAYSEWEMESSRFHFWISLSYVDGVLERCPFCNRISLHCASVGMQPMFAWSSCISAPNVCIFECSLFHNDIALGKLDAAIVRWPFWIRISFNCTSVGKEFVSALNSWISASSVLDIPISFPFHFDIALRKVPGAIGRSSFWTRISLHSSRDGRCQSLHEIYLSRIVPTVLLVFEFPLSALQVVATVLHLE